MKSNPKNKSNHLVNKHLYVVHYNNTDVHDYSIDLNSDEFPKSLPVINDDTQQRTWLHFTGIKSAQLLSDVLAPYNIHPLTQEDILNNKQRPKIESYGHYVFIATRSLRYNKSGLVSEAVYLIIGKNFVFSFQGQENTLFEKIKSKLTQKVGTLYTKDSDFLAYSLLDTVVDEYFNAMDIFSRKVEQLDRTLFSGSVTTEQEDSVLSRIHSLKHDTTRLRKTIMPTREIINQLVRGDYELFKDETRLYLRDVYDHTLQAMEVLDSSKEMILSMMDVYLSYQSNQLNKQMRLLTVITIIFMPLTLISSIYGMNFTNMPELEWKYSYFVVLGIMLTIALSLLKIFSKKHWL